MAKEIYSICFMCTVRCPIRVLVENDDLKWIEGSGWPRRWPSSWTPSSAPGESMSGLESVFKKLSLLQNWFFCHPERSEGSQPLGNTRFFAFI
jgi:anaerobic selenocysteine-containing dehydrogenase